MNIEAETANPIYVNAPQIRERNGTQRGAATIPAVHAVALNVSQEFNDTTIRENVAHSDFLKSFEAIIYIHIYCYVLYI